MRVLGRTPQRPEYPNFMPLAGLPYSLNPWNALPLTRNTGEPRIVTLNTFANTGISCSFESEAVPGTIPRGQNSPRCVRFGLYAEQMTASAFVAPRHLNKNAWLYRSRPAVAHQGFVRLSQLETHPAWTFPIRTMRTQKSDLTRPYRPTCLTT